MRKDKPSEQYWKALDEATAHHATSKTYSGKFLRPHAPAIKALVDEFKVRSVLDYGCGKGEQYRWVSHGEGASIPEGQTLQGFWGVPMVHLYDPAWPPYSNTPEHDGPFDLIIATHVLGSIPVPDLTSWVMPRIADWTRPDGVVYIAEKLGEVRKDVFSDPTGMPRWSAGEWRGFMLGQSMRWKHLTWVLSLRVREDDSTLVERFRYKAGEEKPWQHPTNN